MFGGSIVKQNDRLFKLKGFIHGVLVNRLRGCTLLRIARADVPVKIRVSSARQLVCNRACDGFIVAVHAAAGKSHDLRLYSGGFGDQIVQLR